MGFTEKGWEAHTPEQASFYLKVVSSNPAEVKAAWKDNMTQKFVHTPEEISDTVSATWNETEVIGRSEPFQHYGGTSSREIAFSLTLQAITDAKSEVVDIARWIQATQYPTYKNRRMFPPPVLLFVYGDLFSARVICTAGNPVYTGEGGWTINPSKIAGAQPPSGVAGHNESTHLLPLRATIDLSFKVVNLAPKQASDMFSGGFHREG